MIDIHSHLLPNVDDGSDSLELSRELLIMAKNEGMQGVCVTPHFIKTDKKACVRKYELAYLFSVFKKNCNDIGIQLFLGNELYIDKDLDILLLQKQICALNGSRYVLVEFPFNEYKQDYDEYLYNISLNYKIIIAHPERYSYVRKDYEFVKKHWLDCGYTLQGNAQSLNVKETRVVLQHFLENGQLSFIASDAHNANRPCSLKEAYDYISTKYSKDVAKLLMYDNPRHVLNNEELEHVPATKRKLF